jgi:hypothetical protein
MGAANVEGNAKGDSVAPGLDRRREFYAHSLLGLPPEQRQRLDDHLRNVAKMARGFADAFGAGELRKNLKSKIETEVIQHER